jgi:hypothetical protein
MNCLLVAVVLLQALIYLDMGKVDEALAAGQAALSIRQKVLHNEHPDLAHSLTGELCRHSLACTALLTLVIKRCSCSSCSTSSDGCD